MKASVGSGLGMRLLQWTVHCMDDDRVTLKGCFETVLARSRFGLFILSNFLLVVQSDDVTSAMPLKPQYILGRLATTTSCLWSNLMMSHP